MTVNTSKWVSALGLGIFLFVSQLAFADRKSVV